MTQIQQYIFSILCCGLLLSIVSLLFPKTSTYSQLFKFIGGVVMSIAVLSPILKFDPGVIESYMSMESESAHHAVLRGMDAADDALERDISQRTEAYIIKRAEAMGANVSAIVYLSETDIPAPESVEICGDVSPYTKMKLQQMMKNELNIPEEKQTWTCITG